MKCRIINAQKYIKHSFPALLYNKELSILLHPAIAGLKDGKLCAIPTETVYGLAANALDSEACKSIYRIKGRPSDNPLIVHISSLEMLSLLVRKKITSVPPSQDHGPLCLNPDHSGKDILETLDINKECRQLIEKFWPGPLTLLLPKSSLVPESVTCGLDTVAVRFPAHPLTRYIIDQVGIPLAAPSANLSGNPSPTSSTHVYNDFEDSELEWIVDGGECSVGVESTVFDPFERILLRPGGITAEMLRSCIGNIKIFGEKSNQGDGGVKTDQELLKEQQMLSRPSTPGMKYRHYSPSSPLILFMHLDQKSSRRLAEHKICDFIKLELSQGKSVCRLILQEEQDEYVNELQTSKYTEVCLGKDPSTIARNLFAAIRAADKRGGNGSEKQNTHIIVAESVPEDHEGMAIMNRLSKASSQKMFL